MSVALAAARERVATSLLDALPHAVFLIDAADNIVQANSAAETFFQASSNFMRRHTLAHFVPFGSPLLALIDQVRERGGPVNEYRVDIGTPRNGGERTVDIYATPSHDHPNGVVVLLQERTMADKIDRQLTHRGAARSVSGLAAMLAHEIKNPLSGIRGAAQLLESSVDDEDRALTRLICDEADRIVKLVDRMEVFSDERPIEREPVNIHVVLDHVGRIATSGFARGITIRDEYDPSLPMVFANRDQLIQVFLNLVKNAAEAIARFRRRRDRADHRVQAGLPPVGARQREQGDAAAGILRARQRPGRTGGVAATPVRSVRDHQGERQRSRPRARRQDRSATTAASSSASRSRSGRSSAC